MSRLIVDLSEFRNWSGHHTGVQRVVYGLAANLSDEGQEIVYCTYSQHAKALIEDHLENYAVGTLAAQSGPDSTDTTTYSVSSLARSAYFKIPLRFRQKLSAEQKQKLKAVAKKGYHSAVRLKQKAHRSVRLQTPEASGNVVTLEADDTLIIGGRLWDDQSYQQYIQVEKPKRGFKLAVVIYDLIPIYQQHTFGPGLTEPYSQYLFNALSMADYLLPISRSSEKDLRKFAKETGFVDLPKLHVMRLGDDMHKGDAQKPSWVEDDEKFSICIGTVEARKNHQSLYLAYKLAHEQNVKLPKLYIIGKPGWLTSELTYFIENDLDIKDQIKICSNVSDAELEWLYKHALFTTYPSQYEGWGLPIAESLGYGVPCVASYTSSMIEIAPKLVDHVSPFNTAQLLEVMMELARPEVNKRRREAIINSYKPYKWQDTTRQLKHFLAD